MGLYRGLYRGLLEVLLRGILGVSTKAHMALEHLDMGNHDARVKKKSGRF